MLRRRKVILAVVLASVGGSLGTTIAYAMYLRGDRYRDTLAESLGGRLRLPVDVGGVRPLSPSSLELSDVTVWLPGRRDTVFSCRRASWRTQGGASADHALEVFGGSLRLGNGSWAGDDYTRILHGGLAHDFLALRLSQVHLTDIDVQWARPGWSIAVEGAVGEMRADRDGTVRAALVARHLNGAALDEPLSLSVRFLPQPDLRFDDVRLQVPRVPLGVLGMNELLAGDVTRGTFRGRVIYGQKKARERIEFTGALEDVALAELTGTLPGGPYHGSADLHLDQATFVDRRLDRLRFRGLVSDLELRPLGLWIGGPDVNGRADLQVHAADFHSGRVAYLSLAGCATGLSLPALCRLLGNEAGTITGRLRVDLRVLTVVDNRIRSADVDLVAEPPDDAPGTIDRPLLLAAIRRLAGAGAAGGVLEAGAANVLPEKIEYVNLGLTLRVDGERLSIHGTHGRNRNTILTVRWLDRRWALLKAPQRTFAVSDVMAFLRAQSEHYELPGLSEPDREISE